MPRRRTAAEVLALHLDTTTTPDGCHRFTGAHNRGGYGQLMAEGRFVAAHRLAWELAHGPIPARMRVCHSCDTPDCCRVDHLFLGTAKDNTQDMLAKGRAAVGSKVGTSRLTEDQVREMRDLYDGGVSGKTIAFAYGVHYVTAQAIVTRRTWKHVA